MAHHEDAWLRHRQQRFMRPDAARYLCPDAARFLKPGTDPASVYPALERKYPGQPRLPGGNTGGGRFTFGRRAGDGRPASSASDLSSSVTLNGDGEAATGGDVGEMLPTIDVVADSTPSSGPDFWTGFWSDLDSLIGSIGDIQGGPDDSPPKIPAKRSSRSSKRIGVVRAVSNFLARTAGILADVFLGIVRGVDWLQDYQDVIRSNQDLPKSLQELMDGVGKRRPGYDDHHIIEQTAAEYWGLTRSEIDDPSNLVHSPTEALSNYGLVYDAE
ncbi:hypothetical protein [Rhodopseudomonas sp. P2A-2r]|uniref:hypothetical protein n=1 Tax=unclassified Rhodopseudomonas TaxID=2638247 RepID=UPI0022348633|nr:hypothetical protein [Rhodopseudomonas sp. P2A-2r]UZE47588.1 hypothetical protein ONR75_22140 [Rhodopseudomonas sp. P2A-2r]